MFLAKKILASLILPPAGPLLLALFGLWLARARSQAWRHGGMLLAILSMLVLLALSVPWVGKGLLMTLEVHPPISAQQLRTVQAIVVLGGGLYHDAPEYGGSTVSAPTLERVRYGAKLARESRLPVLVTGGAPAGGLPEGEAMAAVLRDEFGVPVRWVEAESLDTADNAAFAARLLRPEGIRRIALVSHGWHLPRAIALFRAQGFEVVPAPTAFTTFPPSLVYRLLPNDLEDTRQALHEYLGMLFNRLKER